MRAPWQGWHAESGHVAAAPSRDGKGSWFPVPRDVSRTLSRSGPAPAQGLLIACDVCSSSIGTSNNCYWKCN